MASNLSTKIVPQKRRSRKTVASSVASSVAPPSAYAARVGYTPSQYQADIFSWVERGSGNAVVNAVAGSGKCLGQGTPVLLFDGRTIPVEHVCTGDWLMGPDSRPRQVLSTSRGQGPLYRITPVKGEAWVCNDAHILTLAGTNRFTGQVRDVALRDFLATTRPSPTGRIDRQWKLWRTGVEFPARPIDLDPYLVGLWLGDGTYAAPTITNASKVIADYCAALAPVYGGELVVRDDPQHHTRNLRFRMAARGTLGPRKPHLIQQRLAELRVAGEKRIPLAYRANSRDVRLRVLAGLLDTDGYYANGYYEFTTKYAGLRDDMLFLARSLGFAAYSSRKHATIKSLGFSGYYWRITISGELDEIPCLIRKAATRRQIKRTNVTGWDAEPLGEGDYYGFTLSGDGRFLLGDFTVTHNTTTSVSAASLLPARASATFLAFNNHIIDALTAKLAGTSVTARTIHSAGFGMIIAQMTGKRFQKPDAKKYTAIARALTFNLRLIEEQRFELQRALTALGSKARTTLTDPHDRSAVDALCDHYGIVLSVEALREPLYDLLPHLLDEGERQAREQQFLDFDDMIWLPSHWNLMPQAQVDWLFVDELQDLSRAQLDTAMRLLARDGRFIGVGDPKQAIMGFAGAATDSFFRAAQQTQAISLPLSICYRCPNAHLALAREIVPQIEARPEAPEGSVDSLSSDQLAKVVRPGDMILCRLTAPLIEQCIRLIEQGIPARVRGRDIGKQLADIVRAVEHMPRYTWAEFERWLSAYEDAQVARLLQRDDDGAAESMRDRCAAIRACAQRFHASDARALCAEIEALFDNGRPTVMLSTIHRAKGLEAERVFILRPDKLPLVWPKQKAWQAEQEQNLKYVALTRATQALYWVY